MEAVQLLFNELHVYSKDSEGMSALHILMQKRLQMFDSILPWGSTSFSPNIKRNEKRIVSLLKHTSIDPNRTNDMRLLDFCAACTLKNCATIKLLMEKIADVNQSISENSQTCPGYTGLHFAARRGNIKIIKMLIGKGANLLASDVTGVIASPLDICIKLFNVQQVQSILMCVTVWKEILFSDGKTKLMDYVSVLHHPDNHAMFLQTIDEAAQQYLPTDSPLWPGYTILHVAVTLLPESQLQMIRDILYKSGNVTSQDRQGSTPVHLAFHQNKPKIVFLLFQFHERALNPVNKDNLSHLHIACVVNNVNMVRKLLISEANVNIAYNGKPFPKVKTRWTPLHVACFNEHLTVAKILLDAGAYMLQSDIAEPDGIFPLSKLLTDKHVEAVPQLLVSLLWSSEELHGRIEREMGLTMLHILCHALDVEKIKKLLRGKVDVDARTRENSSIWPGFTPLHVLTSFGIVLEHPEDVRAEIEESLKLLLDEEADVTLTDTYGNTPVHMTMKSRYKDQGRVHASLLIKHHRDFSVNPTNKEGLSHFHVACIVGNFTAIKEFLHFDADVNQSCNKLARQSPLHLVLNTRTTTTAKAELQLQTVKLLLEYGADVDAVDARGWTPLHKAIECGRRKYLIDRIIRHGANMNKETIDGKTPFEMLLHDGASVDEIALFICHDYRVNGYNRINGKGYVAMILSDKRFEKSLHFSLNVLGPMMSSPYIAELDDRGRNAIHNSLCNDWIYLNVGAFAVLIEKLIELGCDIHQEDHQGKTPLHVAVELQCNVAIDALLVCGVDVNLIDSTGRPPFFYCLRNLTPTSERLRIHLKKLELVGLEVSQFNSSLLTDQLELDESYKITLRDQLEKTKKVKIGERGLTLYDFVFEKHVVKIISSFTRAERDIAGHVLNTIDYTTFTTLYDLLKLQYRKVLERLSLIEPAAESLITLLGFPLPDLCVEVVFQFLTNVELKRLASAMDENED